MIVFDKRADRRTGEQHRVAIYSVYNLFIHHKGTEFKT